MKSICPFSDSMTPPLRHRQPLYFFSRHSTRFGIGRKHVFHLLKSRARRPPQHAFNHFRNAQERQPPFQKRCHRNFHPRRSARRQRAALFSSLLLPGANRETAASRPSENPAALAWTSPGLLH